jgi:hypothetical protein
MLPSLPQRNARRNERNRWFLLALKGYQNAPGNVFSAFLLHETGLTSNTHRNSDSTASVAARHRCEVSPIRFRVYPKTFFTACPDRLPDISE